MKFVHPSQSKSGFTLIEILIVVAIVGLLSAFIAVNSIESGKQSRDAKRQADLRTMQSQIELYKNKWGRYPEACNDSGWSGQLGTKFECDPPGGNRYILGSDERPFSEFMVALPQDERLDTNASGASGYTYWVNTKGTVYKIMAMNTVESELVNYNHQFKSCDIRPDHNGLIQVTGAESVFTSGWCTYANQSVNEPSSPFTYGQIQNCRKIIDRGNGRFEKSYGLWGGFEPLAETSPTHQAGLVRDTTEVICR